VQWGGRIVINKKEGVSEGTLQVGVRWKLLCYVKKLFEAEEKKGSGWLNETKSMVKKSFGQEKPKAEGPRPRGVRPHLKEKAKWAVEKLHPTLTHDEPKKWER